LIAAPSASARFIARAVRGVAISATWLFGSSQSQRHRGSFAFSGSGALLPYHRRSLVAR